MKAYNFCFKLSHTAWFFEDVPSMQYCQPLRDFHVNGVASVASKSPDVVSNRFYLKVSRNFIISEVPRSINNLLENFISKSMYHIDATSLSTPPELNIMHPYWFKNFLVKSWWSDNSKLLQIYFSKLYIQLFTCRSYRSLVSRRTDNTFPGSHI